MLIGANLQGPRRYIRTHQMKNLCYEPVDLRRVRADGSIDYAAKVGVAPGTMSMWSHGGYPGTENMAALFGIYKSGVWHVRWQGAGRVVAIGKSPMLSGESADWADTTYSLTQSTSGDPIDLTLRLEGDVRNLVVVHEDYVDTYDTDPWLPEYVDEIKRMGWRVLRFDDDSAYPTAWSQRRKPGDLLGRTICLEHRVALCNAVGAHLWFICQGVEAEYWQGALDIIDGLGTLNSYWEIRNEVWNAGHPVIGANYRILRDLFLLPQYPQITGVNEYQRVMRLHAYLTGLLGGFLGMGNFAVLSGQHANPGITRDGLGYIAPEHRSAISHIAPASYMYEAHSATVDWNAATQSLQTAKNRNSAWATLAQEFDKTVVWYEGGNHHNSGLTDNAEFASDPRGANLVSQMLDDAEAKGVMLACAYQHGQPGINEWAFDSSTALGQMYQERNGAAEPLPEPEPVPEPEPLPEPEPEPQPPDPPTGLDVVENTRESYTVTWDVVEGLQYSLLFSDQTINMVSPPWVRLWGTVESEEVALFAYDPSSDFDSEPATLTVTRPAAEPEPSPEPSPEGPTLQDVLDAVTELSSHTASIANRVAGVETDVDGMRGQISALQREHEWRYETIVQMLNDAIVDRTSFYSKTLAAINARRAITGEVTAVDAEGGGA